MKTLAFINSKGGCGKTTSLFHIAGALAKTAGCKVLVIDLDKQGDATNALLSEQESGYEDNSKTKNVLHFLRGEAAFEDVVKRNYLKKNGCRKPSYEGIDVLPYSPKLENQRLLKDIAVREKLMEIGEKYDYVLIDCPPSNRAVEQMVFEQMADYILVPMSSDLDSIRGYGALVEKVSAAREVNENLAILGIYMSMYNKRVGTQKEILSLMEQNFDMFLDVQIPMSSAIVDSKLDGRPISYYKKSAAKDAVEELTKKIIERVQ